MKAKSNLKEIKHIIHRDGTISIRLKKAECEYAFNAIREGYVQAKSYADMSNSAGLNIKVDQLAETCISILRILGKSDPLVYRLHLDKLAS